MSLVFVTHPGKTWMNNSLRLECTLFKTVDQESMRLDPDQTDNFSKSPFSDPIKNTNPLAILERRRITEVLTNHPTEI